MAKRQVMDLMGRTRAVLSPLAMFVCNIIMYIHFCIIEHMYVHMLS